MIEALGSGIWTASAPLKLAGAAFGTRMTIVRVGRGTQTEQTRGSEGLVLIAPIPIDDAMAAEIAKLGTVRAVIAPNAFHHFYLRAALERYPDAACYLAEGVEQKLGQRPAGARDLAPEPDPIWAGDLDQVVLEGAPLTNEVIFYHGESRTLILTDLCFNFDPAPSGWTGLFLRLAGAHGRLAVSRLMRLGIKDRAGVRATLARVLEWDFDRIVVTHGHNIKQGAKPLFVEATRDV